MRLWDLNSWKERKVKINTPIHVKAEFVWRRIPDVWNGIGFPPWYPDFMIIRNLTHFSWLDKTRIRTIWTMLVGSGWVRQGSRHRAAGCAARLGTGETHCWDWRAKAFIEGPNTISSSQHLLFPLLEAEVANPNPFPFFSDIFRIISRNGYRICSACPTENTPTKTAMVSPVEDCELGITLIANSTTVIGHPKIPRDIGWLRTPSNPRLHHAYKLRECAIRGFHQWWTNLPTLLILNSSFSSSTIKLHNQPPIIYIPQSNPVGNCKFLARECNLEDTYYPNPSLQFCATLRTLKINWYPISPNWSLLTVMPIRNTNYWSPTNLNFHIPANIFTSN